MRRPLPLLCVVAVAVAVGYAPACHLPKRFDDPGAGFALLEKTIALCGGAARPHERVVLVKVHKTGSGSLASLLVRFGVGRNLTFVEGGVDVGGRVFETAACPDSPAARAVAAECAGRFSLSVRHVFDKAHLLNASGACAGGGSWFEAFAAFGRDLVGQDLCGIPTDSRYLQLECSGTNFWELSL